jgi:hypothetical protein
MRKKMLLLALSMAALAGALAPPYAEAGGYTSCPICTYYSDGSSCCVSCWCQNGFPVACTDHYCPPADGDLN